MTAAIITASASFLIAVLAYWLNRKGEIHRSSHQAKLERVNSQLRDLYGPLLVLSETNERSWQAFRNKYLPPRSQRVEESDLPEEERERWNRWVVSVFAPSAQKMQDLILSHGDLVIGDEIPRVVLDFCAHATAYKEILAPRNSPNSSGDGLLIRHPGAEFTEYVKNSYKELKLQQSALISGK